jgi:hypothetical protein
MTQEQVVKLLERKGFRWVNTLSDGSQMLLKKKGASRFYAEVDTDGAVNGEDVDDFLRSHVSSDKTFIATELVKIAKSLVAMPVFEKAPNFDETFREFLVAVKKIYNDYMEEQFPKNDREEIEALEGGRYIRIIKNRGGYRSAYCFVDKTNGDILKAASWAAPAKHARGNIFDKTTWKNVGPYGAVSLR